MDWITDPQIWAALATLTILEIVLGIDNIVVISILTGKLPAHQQGKARLVGLGLAMFARVALLFSITLIMRLTSPIFTVLANEISGRDLIMIGGGLFLLGKATHEIHNRLEGEEEHLEPGKAAAGVSFTSIIAQILVLDLVFSLDSVITAVGMAQDLWVMITAVILAILVMMASVGTISDFVHKHPTIKMLALSFLLLIGVMLVAEGLDRHIPRGYIYFAMAFSVIVEILNLRSQRRRGGTPVPLHEQPAVQRAEHLGEARRSAR